MSFDADYPDPLLDLQDQCRDHLEARPFFAQINVLSERPKTIAGNLEKGRAKFDGIYVTVLTTEGKSTDDKLSPESKVFVDLTACEMTIKNRTDDAPYVTATRVITQVIRALTNFKPAVSHEKLRYVGFALEDADQKTGLLMLTARFEAVIRFPADLS